PHPRGQHSFPTRRSSDLRAPLANSSWERTSISTAPGWARACRAAAESISPAWAASGLSARPRQSRKWRMAGDLVRHRMPTLAQSPQGLSPGPSGYGIGPRRGKNDQPTRRVTLGRIRMKVVARTIRVACRYLVCLIMTLLPLFLLVLWPVACSAAQDG